MKVKINFNQSGVYIIEVNGANGDAILNVPVYVGDIYPLIPDFMDLNPTNTDLDALN